MTEIIFNGMEKCTSCTLHETATKPGIPTRPFKVTGKSKVVLIVGEAPGYHEDLQGKSWVGITGKLLEKFLVASGFSDYADVYLANSCRCRPPHKEAPSQKQIKTCREYLLADIRKLQDTYEEVIIFCCGATSCRSLSKIKTLNAAFKVQGVELPEEYRTSLEQLPIPHPNEQEGPTLVLRDPPVPLLFFTYHPAMMLAGRQPAKIHAMEAHFMLVLRYIKGEFMPNQLRVEPQVGMIAPSGDSIRNIISVDIETYGILAGYEQSVFHPAKSKAVDGVEYEDQIVTVSFGYYTAKEGTLKTCLYVWNCPKHRRMIIEWFKMIQRERKTLIGQNLKFDLLYLKYADKLLRYIINPLRITLDDTLLLSFLLYEQQPEKGLKELSTLFGIVDYSKIGMSGRCGTAKSGWDPVLHIYNCTDTAATLVLYKELNDRIKARYGADTYKLKPVCADMRNTVLWSVLELEFNGCVMDRTRLQAVHDNHTEICDNLRGLIGEAGVIVNGTGSQKSRREFMSGAVDECALWDDARLKLTEKKKELSLGADNIELLLGHLPEGGRRNVLESMSIYLKTESIIDKYTRKLLTNKSRGITCPLNGNGKGLMYASWYPVPSYYSKGGAGGGVQGGTIQARFSAKDPPVQTFPYSILECATSRFYGGKLIKYDLGQVELRMAGLLSGDPFLMRAYIDDIDLHTQTAVLISPNVDVEAEGFKESDERQMGKRLNFLVLFKGGAGKFQEVVQTQCGIAVSLEFCRNAIRLWDNRYSVFRAWQRGLVEEVVRKGYLELITGWSRTFGTGRAAAETYTNEICNYPIQTTSAQLMHTAQLAISKDLRVEAMRAVIALQITDALILDVPPEEVEKVDRIVDKWLTRPPLLDILEEALHRSLPFVYDRKVI